MLILLHSLELLCLSLPRNKPIHRPNLPATEQRPGLLHPDHLLQQPDHGLLDHVGVVVVEIHRHVVLADVGRVLPALSDRRAARHHDVRNAVAALVGRRGAAATELVVKIDVDRDVLVLGSRVLLADDEVVQVDLSRCESTSVCFHDVAGALDVSVSDEPLEEICLELDKELGVVAAHDFNSVWVQRAFICRRFVLE